LRTAIVVLGLAAAAPGCGRDGMPPPKKATGFEGRFRASTENGPVAMTLARDGDVVRVTMSGQTIAARVVTPDRVEGAETTEQGGGSFVLTLRGERLAAKFTIRGPDGESLDVPEILFDRVPDAPGGGTRDPALVGRWRHTEARASGGVSYATDVHLVLAEDGTYALWSKSAGTFGSDESPKTTGTWKTEDKRLFLRPDAEDEWREKGGYSVSETHLLLTYGPRDKQVFERL
jgi:hypothetical protein